jgi:NCS1 family nucleobase:cation symporter-1
MAGFFISAVVFYLLNLCFPIENMDQIDSVDMYGTFTETEAGRAGVAPVRDAHFVDMSARRDSDNKDVALHGEKEV